MSSTTVPKLANIDPNLSGAVGKMRLDDRGISAPPASKPQQSSTRPTRTPIVLERAVIGRVKWFDIQKGYGFITRDDGRGDVFVHASAIVRKINRFLVLIEGQKVEFDIIDGYKGREATTVSGPGGMRVGNVFPQFMTQQPQQRVGGYNNSVGGGGYGGGVRGPPLQRRNGGNFQQPFATSTGNGNPMPKGPYDNRTHSGYDGRNNNAGPNRNNNKAAGNDEDKANKKDEKAASGDGQQVEKEKQQGGENSGA